MKNKSIKAAVLLVLLFASTFAAKGGDFEVMGILELEGLHGKADVDACAKCEDNDEDCPEKEANNCSDFTSNCSIKTYWVSDCPTTALAEWEICTRNGTDESVDCTNTACEPKGNCSCGAVRTLKCTDGAGDECVCDCGNHAPSACGGNFCNLGGA